MRKIVLVNWSSIYYMKFDKDSKEWLILIIVCTTASALTLQLKPQSIICEVHVILGVKN